MRRLLLHGAAASLLTVLTQLGGLAWLAAVPFRGLRFLAVFLLAYAVLWGAARLAAPVFGRVAIPCTDRGPERLAELSPLYCALNRNYIAPPLLDHADALARHMNAVFPGTRTRALDAGFPFLDGVPLLPHLSHDDGEKLDLAFFYTDAAGTYLPGRTRSPIGYWAFEAPPPGAPRPCDGTTGPSLRWDMAALQPLLPERPLDRPRSAEMLRWLLATHPTGRDYKLFVEPHLAASLGVRGEALRFQGCRAARHDDHLHLQFHP